MEERGWTKTKRPGKKFPRFRPKVSGNASNGTYISSISFRRPPHRAGPAFHQTTPLPTTLSPEGETEFPPSRLTNAAGLKRELFSSRPENRARIRGTRTALIGTDCEAIYASNNNYYTFKRSLYLPCITMAPLASRLRLPSPSKLDKWRITFISRYVVSINFIVRLRAGNARFSLFEATVIIPVER